MLNQIEKDKLTGIAEDEVLIIALKKVFSFEISKVLPQVSGDTPDEILGQKVRAFATATTLLEDGFRSLNNLKKVVSKKDNYNQAR